MTPFYKNTDGKEKPLLLFSALDWGLGHATRSIPLIKALIETGYDIIIACNTTQKTLLSRELPQVRLVHLEGYEVRYGMTKTGTTLHLLAQLRKILTRIKSENRWLNEFLAKNPVSGVISDNRYGFFSSKVPSVIITHQLHVISGFGKVADYLLQFFIYRFINRFTECWIPDYKELPGLIANGHPGIAGKLSHPVRMPKIPVRYLGCFSRLDPCDETVLMADDTAIDLLIILSGPEPQRSIFEKILIDQLPSHQGNVTLIRGLPDAAVHPEPIKGARIFNYADSKQIDRFACSARMIICRPGYTTIMDMLKLKKKMIVVPTPGQTEQEYLARHLNAGGLACRVEQHYFSLTTALEKAEAFRYDIPEVPTDLYREVLLKQNVFPLPARGITPSN